MAIVERGSFVFESGEFGGKPVGPPPPVSVDVGVGVVWLSLEFGVTMGTVLTRMGPCTLTRS